MRLLILLLLVSFLITPGNSCRAQNSNASPAAGNPAAADADQPPPLATPIHKSVPTGIEHSSAGAEEILSSPDSSKTPDGIFGILSVERQHRIGITCKAPGGNRLVVSQVIENSEASKAGVREGDELVEAMIIDGKVHVKADRRGEIVLFDLPDNAAPVPKSLTNKEDNEASTGNQPHGSGGKPLIASVETTVVNPLALSANQSNRIQRPSNAQLSGSNGRLNGFTGVAGQSALDTSSFAAKASLDNPSSRPFQLNANRTTFQAKTSAEVLSGYQLELLVDRSMSMGAPDCPDNLSRWHWCGQQSAELARSLAPFTRNGLTIATFATKYDVFEHASAQSIYELFNSVQLRSGTRLFEPLAERLDSYFAGYRQGDRPLLIVVITDGVPVPMFEPVMVRDELVKASHRMSYPSQVTVLFCQIGGGDQEGKRYLMDLDENLVRYGARYNFVHTIFFDELATMGLGQSLARAIVAHSPVVQPAPTTSHQLGRSYLNDADFAMSGTTGAFRANQSAANNAWGQAFGSNPIINDFLRPDDYVVNPQVDAHGVRHFGNGDHFDLSRDTLSQVLGVVNEPTERDLWHMQRHHRHSNYWP